MSKKNIPLEHADCIPSSKNKRFLPKSLKDSSLVFSGARFDVHTKEMNDHGCRREAIVHPGAAVILPIIDDKTIVMIRNYRFCVDEVLWELPAGTLEQHESPQETARRELIEETGYQAATIKPLLNFYTTPGICTEKMHAFVATELQLVGQQLEETEEISVEILPWSQVLDLIHNNQIVDGKTLVTLLTYRYLQKAT